MRGWPANGRRVTVLVGEAPAIVRAFVGAIDRRHSDGLAGRSGAIRAGTTADPAYRWNGYTAYQRTAAIPFGAARTLRRGPVDALPDTSGDVRLSVAGQAVMDHLRNITPQGAR